MAERFVVFAYDVTDDRRRHKLARVLRDHGERVLKSGFEGWLDTQTLARLLARLSKLIAPAQDALRVYELCPTCASRVRVLGQGVSPDQLRAPEAIIV